MSSRYTDDDKQKTNIAVIEQEKESTDLAQLVTNNKVVGIEESRTQLLEETEKIIEKGLGDFVAVGEALTKINDSALYKADKYGDFDTYCEERWGMHDKHAYRLMNAAKCVKKLKEELKPQGITVFPTHESQIRSLAALEEKHWVKIWKQVVAKNGEGRITALAVEEVVSKSSKSKDGKKPKNVPKKPHKGNDSERKLKKIAKIAKKALNENSEPSVDELKEVLNEILGLIEKKAK